MVVRSASGVRRRHESLRSNQSTTRAHRFDPHPREASPRNTSQPPRRPRAARRGDPRRARPNPARALGRQLDLRHRARRPRQTSPSRRSVHRGGEMGLPHGTGHVRPPLTRRPAPAAASLSVYAHLPGEAASGALALVREESRPPYQPAARGGRASPNPGSLQERCWSRLVISALVDELRGQGRGWVPTSRGSMAGVKAEMLSVRRSRPDDKPAGPRERSAPYGSLRVAVAMRELGESGSGLPITTTGAGIPHVFTPREHAWLPCKVGR